MTDMLAGVSIITLISQVKPLKTRERRRGGTLNSLAVLLPANVSSSNSDESLAF